MSAQPCSYHAPVHCARSPGTSASSAARSRRSGARFAVEPAHARTRRRTGRSDGARRAGAAAASKPRPVAIEHRLGREAEPALGRVAAEAGLPESDRAAGGVAAAMLLGLDQQDPRGAGASRAPRLAPAMPPPTIRMSVSIISAAWLRFDKPCRLEPTPWTSHFLPTCCAQSSQRCCCGPPWSTFAPAPSPTASTWRSR